jgi:hypothetical protein
MHTPTEGQIQPDPKTPAMCKGVGHQNYGIVSNAHHPPCAHMHICHPGHPTTIQGSSAFLQFKPPEPSCAPNCFCKTPPAPLRCLDRSTVRPLLLACSPSGTTSAATSSSMMLPPGPSHPTAASVPAGLRHRPQRPSPHATLNAAGLNGLC